MSDESKSFFSPSIQWQLFSKNRVSDCYLDSIIHSPIIFELFDSINVDSRSNVNGTKSNDRFHSLEKNPEIIITHKFCDVYYHWMFDILPRVIKTVDVFGNSANIKLPEPIFKYQREWLDISVPNVSLSFFSSNGMGNLSSIVIPSSSTTGTITSPWAIDLVRSLASNIKSTFDGTKVYIRRQGNISRKIVNEVEVEKALSRIGFISVDPALLSVKEQIILFKGAETIVSAHGSALSNIIFCRPGTKVVEIFGPYCGETCYPRIAAHMNLRHLGVQASDLGYFGISDRWRHLLNKQNAPFHFKVDITLLLEALSLLK